MRKKSIFDHTVIVLILFFYSCTRDSRAPVLKGPYLGQEPPGMTPEVFASGVISHGFHELSITFSPDEDELFYITSDRGYTHYALIHVRQEGRRWQPPKVALFARDLNVYSVCFLPDGQALFFTGKPAGLDRSQPPSHDVYRVDRRDGAWGEAVRLESTVNSHRGESSVSVSQDHTLYFTRSAPGAPGDIWSAAWDGGAYGDPVRLGAPINTTSAESRPYIAPDGEYLLFQSNREGSLGMMDLYVAFRKAGDAWDEPVNLNVPINSAASDFGPSVSPDGKYLFFSSYRGLDSNSYHDRSYHELLKSYRQPESGYATLYWVDAKIIEDLKPDDFK